MTCTLQQHQAEVAELLAATLAGLGSRLVTINDAQLHGRVTAEAIHAVCPIPAFTNSQMDGYAARSADLAGANASRPVTLPLGYTVAAGDRQFRLAPGTASPVMTGAMIPEGADTVIPVEQTVSGSFPALVRAGEGTPTGSAGFTAPSPAGRFIRPAGEDLAAGALVAEAGTRLTPTLIGALAASGVCEVAVRHRPRVLVCTTGNELSSDEPGEGRIPDSNSPMIAAWLRTHGAEALTAQLPDDPARLSAALDEHASRVDLVITVGGISAGAYEVVREALTSRGGSFHHVAMQPGGPQGLARVGSTPVICFPGNPVSVLLSLELFLAPLLRAQAGLPAPRPELRELVDAVDSPGNKHQIRRAVLENEKVRVLAPGSHLVHDLARADALVHIPVGVSSLAAGTMIETWRLDV